MILSGSLVNILPGERELGHRLSVGRETIRKALALLERDAWIAPPRIKVPRRILKTTEEETVKNIFCIIPYSFCLFNIGSVNKLSTFMLCI